MITTKKKILYWCLGVGLYIGFCIYILDILSCAEGRVWTIWQRKGMLTKECEQWPIQFWQSMKSMAGIGGELGGNSALLIN